MFEEIEFRPDVYPRGPAGVFALALGLSLALPLPRILRGVVGV